MRKMIGLLVLVCAGWAGSVNAATLVFDGGLAGADGVDILGKLYDVRFSDGTCAGLFSGCDSSDFQFTDVAEAQAASGALLNQVFFGTYDNWPNKTWGCSNTHYAGCYTITPYAVDNIDNSFLGKTAVNKRLGYGDYIGDVDWGISASTSTSYVFARWAPSPVPLPAAAWLFISAIAGLAGAKRLSRSKGSA